MTKPEATDDYKLKIPPNVAKFVDKNAPKGAKIMAAKGLVPMPPGVLITVLFMLSKDGDAEVAKSAEETLLSQPESVIMQQLQQPTHPHILDFFARHQIANGKIVEAVLLNRHTSDDTVIFLAPQVDEKLLTIIADNQERLLKSTSIAEALRKNPKAPKSIIDRMVSFLRMNGILLEGVDAELTKEEVDSILQEDDQAILQAIYEEHDDDDLENLSTVLLDEDEEDEVDKTLETNVLKKISTLNIAEKIKLALKGNKEARTVLIKEPNKLICTSVVKNPRVKVTEVISFAQMRSVNDEVLRLIAVNPEWVKNYKVKNSLVNNPKCPIPIAIQFMKHLRVNDLGILAKNKNVPQAIQKAAKNLFNTRRT